MVAPYTRACNITTDGMIYDDDDMNTIVIP